MKILIIDDDQDIRFMLENFLSRSGFQEILTADSASEAFNLMELKNGHLEENPEENGQIGLILMDIVMPGIDGVEACRKIKANQKHKDLPIIMVTSIREVDYLQKAFEAGAIDYITKPINHIELTTRVRSALKLTEEMNKRKAREKELEAALSDIKVLSGLIPICSDCKKIRNDEGYWQHLEKYISEHSNAHFTHGICEECLQKRYPEAANKK